MYNWYGTVVINSPIEVRITTVIKSEDPLSRAATPNPEPQLCQAQKLNFNSLYSAMVISGVVVFPPEGEENPHVSACRRNMCQGCTRERPKNY